MPAEPKHMVGKANTTLSVIFSILFFGLTATQGLCGQDRGGYIKGQVVDKQTNYPISEPQFGLVNQLPPVPQPMAALAYKSQKTIMPCP